MTKTADHTKALTELVKKVSSQVELPQLPDPDDPISVLLLSMLLSDAHTSQAVEAYGKLRQATVDFNDLRVTLPHELVEILGSRYPRAIDRTQRIRAVLRDVYMREHAMTMQSLAGKGKREIRKYIESLDGITPYAVARVLLLAFDVHAIPVDGQLFQAIVEAGAADADDEPGDISARISRIVKASQGVTTHFALQAWVESLNDGVSGGSRSRSTAGGKTRSAAASKKKTTRKRKTAAGKPASS